MSQVQESSEGVKIPADYIGQEELNQLEFLFNHLPRYVPSSQLGARNDTIEQCLARARFDVVHYGDRLVFGGFVMEPGTERSYKTGISVVQGQNEEVLIVPASITSTQASSQQESDLESCKLLADRLHQLRKDWDFLQIQSALLHQIDMVLVRELWAVRAMFASPDAVKRGRPYFYSSTSNEGWLHLHLTHNSKELSTEFPEFRLSFKPNLESMGMQLVTTFRTPDFQHDEYRPISEGTPAYYKQVFELFHNVYSAVGKAINPALGWYK
ncbi:hypothetical protein [Xanthomonas phage RTH11]|nr:hypothetical protein [Xanthomonas phage RTH11]